MTFLKFLIAAAFPAVQSLFQMFQSLQSADAVTFTAPGRDR